jgi:hypothetical protein
MKKFMICIIPVLALFSAPAVSADNSALIRDFWDFVSENENDIYTLSERDSPISYKIFEKAQLIDRNIYVILDTKLDNNRKSIIITCGGNQNYFDLCDRIVEMAPAYERLNPVSLFPPMETIEPFVYGDIKLGTEDVMVCFDKGNSDIELLFILNDEHTSILRRDDTGVLYNIYMQMLFVMVQQILGERTAGERIRSGGIIPVKVTIPSMPVMELRDHIK